MFPIGTYVSFSHYYGKDLGKIISLEPNNIAIVEWHYDGYSQEHFPFNQGPTSRVCVEELKPSHKFDY